LHLRQDAGIGALEISRKTLFESETLQIGLFEARPDSDACGWNSGMRNSADNRLLQPIALASMLA